MATTRTWRASPAATSSRARWSASTPPWHPGYTMAVTDARPMPRRWKREWISARSSSGEPTLAATANPSETSMIRSTSPGDTAADARVRSTDASRSGPRSSASV